MNEDVPHLLRAIAGGSQAKENRHDIILVAAADEIDRLRNILVEANNTWRHEFETEVNAAAEKLFKRLAAHRTVLLRKTG